MKNNEPQTTTLARIVPAPDVSSESGEKRRGSDRSGGPVSARTVLTIVWRRWFVCTTIGLALGTVAAMAAYKFVPAPFTSMGELRVSSVEDRLLFDTAEQRARFHVFKQTQVKLVTSPLVLNKALENCQDDLIRLRQGDVEEPAAYLADNLIVLDAGTEFIQVSLNGELPNELATVVNSVLNSYLAEVVDAGNQSRQNRLTRLEDLHRTRQDELRRKRGQLQNLTTKLKAANVTQADQQQKFLMELQIQLRRELAEVHSSLIRARSSLATLAGIAEDEAADQAAQDAEEEKGSRLTQAGPIEDVEEWMVDDEIATDPECRALSGQIATIQERIAEESEHLGKKHPTLMALGRELERKQRRLDDLKAELRPLITRRLQTTGYAPAATGLSAEENAVRLQIKTLENRRDTLESELAQIKIESAETGALTFELDEMEKEISQSEQVVLRLGDEINKMEVELQASSGITRHQEAQVPFQRNRKKQLAATAVAGVGAFGLWAGLIVWMELRRQRVDSSGHFASLNLDLLGQVPFVPSAARERKTGRPQTTDWGNDAAASSHRWSYNYTEAIHTLRTTVLQRAQRDGLSSVLITSAVAGEGKTSLACHLAVSLAKVGCRTLLIDADMRRPDIHRLFDVEKKPGLCEALLGEAKLEDCIQVKNDKLGILSAGDLSDEVLELIASGGVTKLLANVRNAFDLVIVDSSPLLPVSDGLSIASQVDGVMFSVHRDVSRTSYVRTAVEMLNRLDVPVIGAVGIGLHDDFRSSPYYYYDNDYYYSRNVS